MLKWILMLIFIGCATSPERIELKQPVLRPEIQAQIDGIRDLIAKNQFKPALNKIYALRDDHLSEIEKAVKYNLKGVIFYHESLWDKALANFEIAKKYIPQDSTLRSQVYLNIGSVHAKQLAYPELKMVLDQIIPEALSEIDVKKYAQLKMAWALKYEKHFTIVESGVIFLKDAKSFDDLKAQPFFQVWLDAFKKLSDGEKIKILDRFKKLSPTACIFLAQTDADEKYFKGDKSGAKDLVNWLDDEYSIHPLVVEFVKEFNQRLEVSSRISNSGIGVVLPLSGEKSIFGQRTLFGMELALKENPKGIELYTKDNMGSVTVGAQAVRDVIFEKKVPLIIGGLFPDLAKAEYLEARKYGVMFISLAPVQVPREQKTHLLIEVPGSVESQITKLSMAENLSRYGKRVGVIYPEGEYGQGILNEFWRNMEQGKLQITAVASYPKQSKEYLDTVQRFLGLKYTRERKEENAIWQNVYSGEKSTIRRIQYLPPVIDFDWVYLATLPHESQSLIPTFAYYDAKDVFIVGGPTWGSSKDLLRDQKMWNKPIYFVGEDPSDVPADFFKKFFQSFNKNPGVVEAIAYDGMKIAMEITNNSSADDREEFEQNIIARKSIRGMNKDWNLMDGIWIKTLDFLSISKGEIRKVIDSNQI